MQKNSETIILRFQPGLFQAPVEKEVEIVSPKDYKGNQLAAWTATVEGIKQRRLNNGQ